MKKIATYLRDLGLKLLADVGIINDQIVSYIPVVATIFGKIIAIQNNPAIQAIEDIIIGAKLEQSITNAIHWAFDKFTLGTQIEADYKAAPDLPSKIKVVLEDLIKGDPDVLKMKIGDIAALVIKYLGGDKVSISIATRLIEDEVAKLSDENANPANTKA